MITQKRRNQLIILALFAILSGCDGTTNKYIEDCNNGDRNACKEIAKLNNNWAHSQITKKDAKGILQREILIYKYRNDIKAADECITGQNSACDQVNTKNIELVNKKLVPLIKERLKQIKEAKRQGDLLVAEKATWGPWEYSSDEDMATGKKSYTATLDSENMVDFSFPYSGPQYGQLMLRNHPRYGFDAIISIQKGQILCSEYSNPYILVRFDNGSPIKYECSAPADNSTVHSFISDAESFEQQMRSASVAYITLTFYQEGSQTFKFKVKGYDKSKI